MFAVAPPNTRWDLYQEVVISLVRLSCARHVRAHVMCCACAPARECTSLILVYCQDFGRYFCPLTHAWQLGRHARYALAASFPFTPRIRAGFAQAKFIWKEVLQSPMDESPRNGFFAGAIVCSVFEYTHAAQTGSQARCALCGYSYRSTLSHSQLTT